MGFQQVRFRPLSTTYVAFAASHISFSDKLLTAFDIAFCEHVELGIDAAARRLYFRFLTADSPESVPFARLNEGSGTRIIAAKPLYGRFDWLAAVLAHKEPSRRRFVLEERSWGDRSAPDGFLHFVTVDPSRVRGLRFDPKHFPQTSGIYWLLNEFGDIMRIGEAANLASSLYTNWQHLSREVKAFDYEEETNARQRLRKSNQYVREYMEAFGREPKYNPVHLVKDSKGGKR